MDACRSTTTPKTASNESMENLLNLLTAVKWDLKSGLRDGAAAPEELATNIGRLFDDIDASINRLRDMIHEHGPPPCSGLESRSATVDLVARRSTVLPLNQSESDGVSTAGSR